MKIVFMGTPDFALKSLKALYEENFEIAGVVTNQDKPKGRGMKLVSSPVKEYALEKNLNIFQPIKVRNNVEFLEKIKEINPDLLCVVAYGKILPKELLDIPKYGAINVHGSLLPKYRGAPIQWAVLNGDKETGITTMFMDEGMDTGDMILKEKVEIGEDETTGQLWDRLSEIGAKLLVETVKKIENISKDIESTGKEEIKTEVKEKIGAIKQEGEFSLAPMLDKEIAKIDWNKTSREIKNKVRGLNPIKGAYSFLNWKKIKIWKVEISNDISSKGKKCGDIVLVDKKKGLFVKTNDGVINILEIQGENSKRMDIKSFLNGNDINENMKFSDW